MSDRHKKVMSICLNKTCRVEFEVNLSDAKRGWGKFCSKSCKAIKQTRDYPPGIGIEGPEHEVL